jgi:hypothetical protein
MRKYVHFTSSSTRLTHKLQALCFVLSKADISLFFYSKAFIVIYVLSICWWHYYDKFFIWSCRCFACWFEIWFCSQRLGRPAFLSWHWSQEIMKWALTHSREMSLTFLVMLPWCSAKKWPFHSPQVRNCRHMGRGELLVLLILPNIAV